MVTVSDEEIKRGASCYCSALELVVEGAGQSGRRRSSRPRRWRWPALLSSLAAKIDDENAEISVIAAGLTVVQGRYPRRPHALADRGGGAPPRRAESSCSRSSPKSAAT